MEELLKSYLEELKFKNKSDNTIEAYGRDIKTFIDFIESREESLEDTEVVTIMAYAQELKIEGKSDSSINRKIIAVKGFYKYLIKRNILQNNTFDKYDMKQIKREVPSILTIEEVSKLLATPDTSVNKGIRDKAMLEVLYATGMKVTELLNITVEDVNLKYSYIKCRNCKSKERIIPLGSYAINSLEQYLKVRDEMNLLNIDTLFLNSKGQLMTRQGFWKIIKGYSVDASIDKEINANTLRHSFAVHLLQNGADIRSIQELLGHSGINVTQIYTSIIKKNKLAEVYKNAHPRA